MAETKNVNMFLRLSAAWAGAGAFKGLHASLGNITKGAGLANLSLGKLAAGAAAVVLGFKGMQAIGDFMKGAITHAHEAQAANQKLGIALARNPKLAKLGAEAVAGQQRELIALAEKMEESGGIGATRLAAGFAGLSAAGFGPKLIGETANAFQDLTVAMNKQVGSAQDVADVANKVRAAVKQGLLRPFVQAGLVTKEQVKQFSKLKTEGGRLKFMMELIGKQSGKMAEYFKTDAGKMEKTKLIWETLQKTMGKPFIDTQLAFAEAMGAVGLALTPLAKDIAQVLTPALKDFANWVREQTPNIEKFGKELQKSFEWVVKNWEPISKGLLAIGAGFAVFATVSAILNPVTLAVGLLAGGILLLAQHWDKIEPAAKAAWEGMTKIWTNVSGWVNKEIIEPLAAGENAWDVIGKGARSAWDIAKSAFVDVGSWAMSTIVQPIADATREMWEPLVEPVSKLWAKIAPYITAIGKHVLDALKDIPKEIGEVFSAIPQILSVIGPMAQQAFANWSAVVGWIGSNVLTPIIDAVTGIIDKLEVGDLWGAFQTWKGAVDQIRQNIVDKIVALFSDVTSKIASSMSGVAAAIAKPFMDAWNMIPDFIKNLFGGGLKGSVDVASNVSHTGGFQSGGAAEASRGTGASLQMGGLVSSPTITALAERGRPEMVIPLQRSTRSEGLLSQTAQTLGMGGMAKGGGQAGPMSVNTPISITINGAPEGQEGAIGREIERAMENPIRELLEQLRQARDEERRQAYV